MKLILVMILLVAFAHNTWATNQKEFIVVKNNRNYPPYEMMVSEKEATGIHMDLIKIIAKRLNVKLTILSVPWKRALLMVKLGEADAITYIGRSEERERWAWFNDKNILSSIRNGFFVLASKKEDFDYHGDLRQLQGYRIGTILGYAYDSVFENATFLKKDAGAKDESALLRKLIYERFDVGIADVNMVRYFAKQLDYSKKIEILTPYLPLRHSYIAFSKARSNKQFSEKFGEKLSEFKKTLKFREILYRYGIEYMY